MGYPFVMCVYTDKCFIISAFKHSVAIAFTYIKTKMYQFFCYTTCILSQCLQSGWHVLARMYHLNVINHLKACISFISRDMLATCI
jgi:hypothetical protein